MKTKVGGSSQDRRRARRAAERSNVVNPIREMAEQGGYFDSLIARLDAPAELTAAAPMSGECSNCGHMAAKHRGEYNDGACAMKSCSCKEMEEMSADAAAETEELAIPSSADYRPAENDNQSCATCSSYSDGECSKWDAPVDEDYTCDSWTKETASLFQIKFPQTVVDEAAEILARGAVLTATDDPATSGDLGAAIKERFASFVLEFDSLTADAVEIPVEHTPGATLPEPNPSPAAPPSTVPARGYKWTAVFVPEATLTDDGRAMAPGSVKWRELPLTLMGLTETSAEGGHDGAIVCGRIDSIWRDGYLVRASGVFDESEYGLDIARMVGEKTLTGVSVDLAIHEYEVGPKSDYFDADGNWLDEKPEPAVAEDGEEPSMVDLLFGTEDAIFVVTDAVIGCSTVCPFPAFADASIALEASLVAAANPAVLTVTQQAGWTVVEAKTKWESAEDVDAPPAITASAAGLAPVKPPVEWFADPKLEELTPLTVTEDGRVFGHAWAWDSCHLAFADVCTTAPHTETNYAYFLLKEVECEGGERVPVGTVTIDTGHAEQRASRADATAHYDHTGCAVVDVNVGEDEHGGWFAGALRPDVDAEKVRALSGAVLSGDWRNVNGNLELVALLAVNVPGFPVPRMKALVAAGSTGGEVLALVAAGMHNGPRVADPEQDFREIAALSDQASGAFRELVDRVAA